MLQGYIDKISPDRLTLAGWVEVDADGLAPTLYLDRGGDREGTVVFGDEREDVKLAKGVGNRRFTLTLDEPLDYHGVLSKAHTVSAVSDFVRSVIPWGGHARTQIVSAIVKEEASKVPGMRDAILQLFGQETSTLAKYLGEVRASAQAGELSYLGFPVGLRSSNDVAQIGRNGHLFLTGGSNALRTQYEEPANSSAAAALEGTARQWADAFTTTRGLLRDRGTPFLQILIPEKLTALRHLAPFAVEGPTPLYRRVDELLAVEPEHLSFLRMFEDWDDEICAWQKNDTHCSPAGSLAMARAVLARLPGCDPALLSDVRLTHIVYRNGDLTEKFFDIPIWDKQYQPAPDTFGDPRIEHVYSHVPGHFVGSRHVWRNADAPIDKKVVVFGNSFFGSVDQPTRLSWWFARLFREYHLRWDNFVDLDYVQAVNPDYVLFQTIERFLVRPPARAAEAGSH